MKINFPSTVRPAQSTDRCDLAKLRTLLWPDAQIEEHLIELDGIFLKGTNSTLPMTILVAYDENGALIGFIEVAMRSHADGCSPTRPVGFVEGWFVRKSFREQGIGRKLMRAAEEWARSPRCIEIGSDALIENQGSQGAHKALGFEIVDRCVHFRKAL
jgi:aminoglycoside 6'-N-acetyltransferase I